MRLDKLIEQLQSRYEPDMEIVDCIWIEEDIVHMAEEEGVELDHQQIMDVVASLEANQDAEYGMCWDSIRTAIQNEVRN